MISLGSVDLILVTLFAGLRQILDELGDPLGFFKILDQVSCYGLLYDGKVMSMCSQNDSVLLGIEFEYPGSRRIWKVLYNSYEVLDLVQGSRFFIYSVDHLVDWRLVGQFGRVEALNPLNRKKSCPFPNLWVECAWWETNRRPKRLLAKANEWGVERLLLIIL